MKKFFPVLFVVGLLLFTTEKSEAQTGYYAYATPAVRRYNITPGPPYRHYEDVRRYNAAPKCNGYLGPEAAKQPVYKYSQPCDCVTPVKVRTEIVSRQCQGRPYYDECGRRCTRKVTITIYKDIYSDGRCRIWRDISY
ncbi:MAG: hypothetical protein P1V20_11010 [Verrucomicrobiales bacterium]|nr:hypothetical protein [Verrucomicrobiales bacterium]